MQEIVNYFLFALNLIIFATVAFAALAYLIQHLNQRSSIHSSSSSAKNLPLYDILLDYNHRDVDHWYSWIKTQSKYKQEEALQMLINYLSEPIDYKGLITRDVLRVITKFQCDDMFSFLEDFSKSALKNWHKNKAIASFYEESLLSLIEINSSQAASSVISQLEKVRNDPSKDIAAKYMVSALSKLENLAELQYSFKQIAMDELYPLDFRIDSLDTLKMNGNHHVEVVAHCLKELLEHKAQNSPLFDYFINSILESGKLESNSIQDILMDCFAHPDLEYSSTQVLLEHLSKDDFYISQKLIFRILNTVNPKNYKYIKKALVNRSKFSDSELSLLDNQENVSDTFEELVNNSFDFKIFNFEEPMLCDPFLNEELVAMGNLIAIDKKPSLKLVYGKSKLEKQYILKVLASVSERSLLVLDLENILNFGTDLVKLDQVLSQDPNKIVFFKNFKIFMNKIDSSDKRKQARQILALLRKYLRFASSNFIACVEDKLTNMVEQNPNYQSFFEENSDIILHSYTFDIPTLERKKGIYKTIIDKVSRTRAFDLNSFDDLEQTVDEMSHFEYINYIYKFFHDSLLTFKKVMSVKKYNHLLQDKRIFETKKPLLNLNYVS